MLIFIEIQFGIMTIFLIINSSKGSTNLEILYQTHNIFKFNYSMYTIVNE